MQDITKAASAPYSSDTLDKAYACMDSHPLVSVIIIGYDNFDFLFEAVESVLRQDYPNIELIISNDGSPDFDGRALSDYISAHKRDNIKNIILNQNPENLGTVRHLNVAFPMATGEYITYFAADDAMYCEKNRLAHCLGIFPFARKRKDNHLSA